VSIVSSVRVVQVLGALSLTTDLAMGRPFEKGLRTCIVADSLALVLGLDAHDRRVVFDTALLRSVGCTSSSSESASLFGDEFAFGAAVAELDPGRSSGLLRADGGVRFVGRCCSGQDG
jgi:hypothetical protein